MEEAGEKELDTVLDVPQGLVLDESVTKYFKNFILSFLCKPFLTYEII